MPLHPAAQAIVDSLGDEPPPRPDITPATVGPIREMMASIDAANGGPGPELAQVENRTIPGPGGDLSIRIYTPVTRESLPVTMWFHGGGFLFGSIDGHDTACRHLALASDSIVVSINYRLAPEHLYPAAVDDCFAALKWVAEHAAEFGGDPGRLAVAGDSAGGNLAAVVALRARDAGAPALRFQALIYPVVDPDEDTEAEGEFYVLRPADKTRALQAYAGDADINDPDVSPLRAANLSGLPPTLIITAEYDALRLDGEAYAAALERAGVPVTYSQYDGMIHGFFTSCGVYEDSIRAVYEAGQALRLALTRPSDLTIDERAALTAGVDMWHSAAVERLGIREFIMTDGPSGARGEQFTGTTSLSMPCGTALASSWNRELIGRVGEVLGDEARSKQARVLLAPTVNIHRHPLGGRNFECYSEDPFLTAEMAVAYINGVQSRGVACCVKHFALNDQESERMKIDVVADERTRREIYLVPFEAAVQKAGVWSVMSAYNRVDGTYCSEHPGLLTGILRDEWSFDGFVISDWFGTHSAAALPAGLDLEMPGPAKYLGHHLKTALESGEVAESDVDTAVERFFKLLARVGSGPGLLSSGTNSQGQNGADVAREAATEGIVLLANDGVLPLDPDADAVRIAVLGWRAERPEFQGGGSAQVNPAYVTTPLEGITDRAGASRVVFEAGRAEPKSAPLSENLRIDYFPHGDFGAPPLHSEPVRDALVLWLGEPAPGVPGEFSARLSARFTPERSGTWTFSVSCSGDVRLLLDGEQIADTSEAERGAGYLGIFTAPVEALVELQAGETYDIVAELDTVAVEKARIAAAGIHVEARAPAQSDAPELAVRAATDADVAVVVVGHDHKESEGQDHHSIELPEHQIELIHRVAMVNPRTIVVVNSASPTAMPWVDDEGVAAVVQMPYLGQETGAALAAMLFGDTDASGRLTTTFPERIEDSPAFGNFAGRGDRSVEYAEGIFVGYRHYDTKGVEPRWCFGHGLSYTTFSYSGLQTSGDSVSVDVTNTGRRPGSEVVQLYVRDVESTVVRPDKELKGFAKVRLEPGETTTVTLPLDERAFAYWSTEQHEWIVEPGEFEILVGSSSRDIRQSAWLTR